MAEGVINKHVKGGWCIAKFHSSGAIFLNSANALLGANSAGETVTRMNIISAEWSAGNGAYWVVKRGANTVLTLSEGQDVFDFSDSRLIDNYGGEPQANVVVTKVGSGPTTLILKLHKTSSIAGGSQY
jgi:hypothetical protein